MENEIVQVLTISELERASGVRRSTIHYYIREGLLPQPQKTAGTRSLYSEHHLELLERIATAKAAGRSLPAIRAELQLRLTELNENAIDLKGQEYERTHRAILDLATKEFVRKGYRATRLADLIRKLEMSSSVFYSHFPSKHHLLVESYCTFVEWSIDYVEPKVAESSDMVDRMLTRSATGFSVHGLSSDVMALVNTDTLPAQPELMKRLQDVIDRISRHVADDLAGMRAPGAAPAPIPDDMLAYALGMAFHAGMVRAASDSTFSLLDFVRTIVWLWLAVRGALGGQLDVNGELAQYEDRIQQIVTSPPPVFPALEE